MLILTKQTGSGKLLSIWRASFKFEGSNVKRGKGMLAASNFTRYTSHSDEGRLCETNPISVRPATIHHRDTEITETVFRVSDRDCSMSFSVPSVSPWWRFLRNEPNLGRGDANGKCLLGKELWCIRFGRGDGKTKPIPRRAASLPVPPRIGFVSHNCVASVGLWGDNPGGAEAPETA
jgi:hypothetical protein